ncbi:MAG: hypothetical protein E6063_07445, partial [Atopobium sp.]|nr:hypothetical protein [Atopobium sp.]
RAQQSLLQKEIPSSFTSLSAKTDEIIIAKEAIYCRYRQNSKLLLPPIILAIVAMKLGVFSTYNTAA